jgi:predicted transglutaminase-like cysteine proteinase
VAEETDGQETGAETSGAGVDPACRKWNRELCAGLVLLGVFGFTASTRAQEDTNFIPRSDPMPDIGVSPADPPPGFVSFCIRFADQCDSPNDAASSNIHLTPLRWRDLLRVNRWLNHEIHPMDDLHHYGRLEYWTIPSDSYGDCEDYALAKRAALIRLGFPMAALRIAVVRLPRGEGHAVLTVVTDRGDYVLDNESDAVSGWRHSNYQWIERQDVRKKSGWVLLQQQPRGDVPTASIAPVSK